MYNWYKTSEMVPCIGDKVIGFWFGESKDCFSIGKVSREKDGSWIKYVADIFFEVDPPDMWSDVPEDLNPM